MSDLQKHVEILVSRKFTPRTILEIGSRDGHDAKFYQSAFNINDSDVYVVEPNPIMANYIRHVHPNYNLFQVAVSPKEGVQIFNQVISDCMLTCGTSSLLDRNDGHYDDKHMVKIEVNTISGKTLLEKIDKDIDICKIDVEGYGYEVLSSFDDMSRIKSIHLETEHQEFWTGQKTHKDVCQLMNDIGYELVHEDFHTNGPTPIQSDTIWIRKELL